MYVIVADNTWYYTGEHEGVMEWDTNPVYAVQFETFAEATHVWREFYGCVGQRSEIHPVYYYVRFHSDGGQMCDVGLRCFLSAKTRDAFAELCRSQPGHICQNSVSTFESIERLPEAGHLALRSTPPSCDLTFHQRQLELTGNAPE